VEYWELSNLDTEFSWLAIKLQVKIS
jgi:hypothetical protein